LLKLILDTKVNRLNKTPNMLKNVGLKSSQIALLTSKAHVVLFVLLPMMALKTENTDFTNFILQQELFPQQSW